jgi:hypothetical protein
VTSEPTEPHLLPIACTLGPGDGADRLDDWRRVASIAAIGRSVAPGKITLRFRNEPAVGVELERLVAAERTCCAFLGWKLTQVDQEWRVEITGADEDLGALPV